MVTLEELVPLGYPQERIDETDQDQQYCRVTDQEAREAYCRSTPDIFTKPMTEDKFPTYRGLMYGTNRRRTEKIRRLVKLWSERDLAHLPTMQRVAQEREMENAYKTFDEKGLDTALTIIEHKQAPVKVESSGEETPSDPTKREEIVLQTRRGG
jgi:hypothetical protein